MHPDSDSDSDPSPASGPNARPQHESTLSTRKKLVFALVPAAVLALVAYVAYAAYHSKQYYDDLKTAPQWDTRMMRDDPELGYAPIPNSVGHLAQNGEHPVFSSHDENGFRAARSSVQEGEARRPIVLALGDSFTYGYGIEAEQGFPHLVARAIGGTAKNAGGNGYGLAQMLLLARRHIPAQRPDYVLVQYSPWVTARAIYPYAPTALVTIPVPHFAGAGDAITMTSPVFRAQIDRFPAWKYSLTDASLTDFLSFFVRIGLPLHAYNDMNLLFYRAKRFCGLSPAPALAKERRAVDYRVYEEIGRICRENGSTMIVVVIGNWQGDTEFITDVIPSGVLAVRADEAMLRQLPERTGDEFIKRYAIRWGDRINFHHNAEGNRIIALSVLEAIRQVSKGSTPRGVDR